jgi:hypothetical protein
MNDRPEQLEFREMLAATKLIVKIFDDDEYRNKLAGLGRAHRRFLSSHYRRNLFSSKRAQVRGEAGAVGRE